MGLYLVLTPYAVLIYFMFKHAGHRSNVVILEAFLAEITAAIDVGDPWLAAEKSLAFDLYWDSRGGRP